MDYSIRVYKEYFNYAAAHFMIFNDGTRESLHGHNYRLQVKAHIPKLTNDMVFDFLHLKPIVRKLCDELDHKVLLPTENSHLKTETQGPNTLLKVFEDTFSLPTQDLLFLPIPNTSVERFAAYFARKINNQVFQQYKFRFPYLEVEVEESLGQSGVYVHKESL